MLLKVPEATFSICVLGVSLAGSVENLKEGLSTSTTQQVNIDKQQH